MAARVLLALSLCAVAAAEEPKLAPVRLPESAAGVPDRDDDPFARLVLTLDAKGRLFIDGPTDATLRRAVAERFPRIAFSSGTARSLDHLSEALRTTKQAYEKLMKERGRDATVVIHGIRASQLYVLLRADRDAPWAHLLWIMTILAEERIFRLQCAVVAPGKGGDATTGLERKMDAFLPTDKGVALTGPRPETFEVDCIVRGDAYVERERGGRKVRVPTGFQYVFGKHRTRKRKEIARWIREELEAAKEQGIRVRQVEGVVQAGRRVPAARGIEVLGMFLQAGFERVWARAWRIPDARERRAVPLPWPEAR